MVGHKIIPGSICTNTQAGTGHVIRKGETSAAHAEMNTAKSLRYSKRRARAVIIVIRFRLVDGHIELMMSRPCTRCARMMCEIGVKKVVYSVPGGLERARPRDVLKVSLPSFADRILRRTMYVKGAAYRRIALRLKSVELRVPKGFNSSLCVGEVLNISNGAGEVTVVQIVAIRKYYALGNGAASLLRRVLKKEGIKNILPQIRNLRHGIRYLLYGDGTRRAVFR